MLNHRNTVSNLLVAHTWQGMEKGNGVCLSGFPFFHTAGLFFNIGCVYAGLTQILIPDPRDTNRICGQIEKYKPKYLVNVPSLYQLLVKNPKFRMLDHSNLETCISGASPFPEDSQKEFESIVGKGKLLETFGMTETSPLAACNPHKGKKKLGSIGLPLLNTDIKLVDSNTGEPIPIGKPGEICVKGPQVMVGYYNKPEATEKVFDADGFLHTGDVAVFDENGYLSIVDRVKDMIIVGGYKVFSKRVEEILTNHPAIDMIAMIGLPNPDRPGSEIVKAFIKISPNYMLNGDVKSLKDDMLQFAKEKLAPYEIPKILEFTEEIPLTGVGKVDKKKLRERG